ncbi:MAG: hypothetical protein KF752_08225 [Pirellulaceae bacterium]|nr:hypothetical protein [Pirellulaceae bacterium]
MRTRMGFLVKWMGIMAGAYRSPYSALSALIGWFNQMANGQRQRIHAAREFHQALSSAPPIYFRKLEARRVLNATFEVIAGELQLANFADGAHLDIQMLLSDHQFTLSSGTWFDSNGIDTTSSILSIALTGGLNINSLTDTNIFLQGDLGTISNIDVSTLGDVSDSSGTSLVVAGDFIIAANRVTLGEDALDSYSVGALRLNTTGASQLNVDGSLHVLSGSAASQALLVADTISLESFSTSGALAVLARGGDVLIGTLDSGTTIDITAIDGSILDWQDDQLADLTANGTITLQAAFNISGNGADGRLELSADSVVIAQSFASGDIRLYGLGDLTLTSAITQDGAVDVTTNGTLNARLVDTSQTDSTDNSVNLSANSMSSDVLVGKVRAGQQLGQVWITAERHVVDGDNDQLSVDVAGQFVHLVANQGNIGEISGSIFQGAYRWLRVQASQDLSANAPDGVVILNANFNGTASIAAPTAIVMSAHNVDLNSWNIVATNLAVIADADGNSTGTAILPNTLNFAGDLRVQGADVSSNGSLSLVAQRILLISGQSEQFTVGHPISGQSVQVDARTHGDLVVTAPSNVVFSDLDGNGYALQATPSGSIHVRSTNGSLIIDSQVADYATNVLLEAALDVTINANVTSVAGNITVNAGDDIVQNALVSAGGAGTVYFIAGNNTVDATAGIVMNAGAVISTAGGNVQLVADNGGDILLTHIDVGAGRVSLVAEGDILNNARRENLAADALAGQNQLTLGSAVGFQLGDLLMIQDADSPAQFLTITAIAGTVLTMSGNLAQDYTTAQSARVTTQLTNVRASALSLRADANISNASNGQGTIGRPDTLTADSEANSQAVTTQVDILAARSAEGIYILEADELAVDSTGDITVTQVVSILPLITNPVTASSLSDLVTTNNGNILLASVTGNLTINDGALGSIGGANGQAVSAHGTGNILLQARGGGSDLILNSQVQTDTGSIFMGAGGSIAQNSGGNVLVTNGALGSIYARALTGSITMAGDASSTTQGGHIHYLAQANVTVGVLNASTSLLTSTVAVTATTGSILDGQNDTIGLDANGFATQIGTREVNIIGDAANLFAGVNVGAAGNPLDTQVVSLASGSNGNTYIYESNALTIGTVASIAVAQVQLNSNAPGIPVLGRNGVTANSQIKIETIGGTQTIASQVGAGGNILLAAGGVTSDLLVNAAVGSGSGHISLVAGRDVAINAAVITGGTGSVYVQSGRSIDVQNTLTTQTGDILLSAAQDISQSAIISSTSGDIGLVAGGTITHTAVGHITASGGDVLVRAGNNWTMAAATTLTAGGGDVVGQATAGTLQLGVIRVTHATGNRIGLSAGVSIVDANGGGVNIEETVAAATTTVSLRAGTGTIGQADAGNGTPGINANALDLNVDTVAASSAQGIYLRELAAGGGLIIGVVPVAAVTVDAQQVNLNSTQTVRQGSGTLAGLAGGTTTNNGPVKVVAESGSLTVASAVSAQGTGDVLLEARGVASDVLVNATVGSGSGHISLIARDDIAQVAGISTGGGTVYVQAVGGAVIMGAVAFTVSSGGNIDYMAAIDASLGQLNAGTGTVSITAGRDILDSHNDTVSFDGTTGFVVEAGSTRVHNIIANAAKLRSGVDGTLLAGGNIGTQNNPLDTRIGTLASVSKEGTYLYQSDPLVIGSVAETFVTQVHFNSGVLEVGNAALVGGTSGGQYKLWSSAGSVTVDQPVTAATQIVLAAGPISGNLIVKAAVTSNGSAAQGNIWFAAGGSVYSPDLNGLLQFAEVDGVSLTLYAQQSVFLPNTHVDSLEARMVGARNQKTVFEGDQQINAVLINANANASGPLILEELKHDLIPANVTFPDPLHPIGTTPGFNDIKASFEFTNRFVDGYALFVRNAGELSIEKFNFGQAMEISGTKPAVYVETLGASDLKVKGEITLVSETTNPNPGIVLIAGQTLSIEGGGSLNLESQPPGAVSDYRQVVYSLDLKADAYDAGLGPIVDGSVYPVSTKFVVDASRKNLENEKTHFQQRVRMEFGNSGESGFMTIVHYADNRYQQFTEQADVAQLAAGSNFKLDSASGVIQPISNTVDTPAVNKALFARSATTDGNFDPAFLANNRDLPTDVVIRRSLDFFLFSNGQADNSAAVIDHTSAHQDVLGVETNIETRPPLTPDPPPSTVPLPAPVTPPNPLPLDPPLDQARPEYEPGYLQPKTMEVAIYPVHYEDENGDGQVDAVELPDYEDVLAKLKREGKIVIKAQDGGTPTQGEIEQQKLQITSQPDQPSGAYSIIRKLFDGSEEVLDVFSIRDWPEQVDAAQADGTADEVAPPALKPFTPVEPPADVELPLPPPAADLRPLPLPPTDPLGQNDSRHALDDSVSPRFAGGIGLLSSLWLYRRLQSGSQGHTSVVAPVAGDSATNSAPPTEFCRRARRLRKLRYLASTADNS